jgi:hypothetical protein
VILCCLGFPFLSALLATLASITKHRFLYYWSHHPCSLAVPSFFLFLFLFTFIASLLASPHLTCTNKLACSWRDLRCGISYLGSLRRSVCVGPYTSLRLGKTSQAQIRLVDGAVAGVDEDVIQEGAECRAKEWDDHGNLWENGGSA